MLISSLTLAWVSLAGPTTNGAQRWISLLGLQFQPSELGKGTLVLAVAQILSATQTGNGADKKALKIIAIASAFIVPFIFIETSLPPFCCAWWFI